MPSSFEKQFENHETQDEVRFGSINDKLDVIKDNHLAHIQASMATLEANYRWLKYILGIMLTAIIAGFYQLITR